MNLIGNIARNNHFKLFFILLITFLLGFVMLQFIDRYSATLIIRDRWNSLDPLFNQLSFWEGFTHQHGPHRMGLAYLLFKINTYFSGWDGRWDMFTQGVLYILSSLMALRLKFLIFSKWHWTDVCIPLILITLESALTITANPYVHGLIPFMALAVSLSYFITNNILRVLVTGILSFASVFTGFSLVITLMVLLIEVINLLKKQPHKLGSIVIILFSLAGMVYFFTTQKMGSTFSQSFGESIFYTLQYGFLLSCNFLFSYVNPQNYWVGIIAILTATPLVLMWVLINWNSNDKKNKVILILLGSSIAFILLNLYGRIDLGLPNALTSRYIPATMPMLLALYVIILKIWPAWLRYVLLLAFTLAVTRPHLKTESPRVEFVKKEYKKIIELEKCLLADNYSNCSQKLDYSMHPRPDFARIQEKLDFFRENKLSIYSEKIKKQP